MPLTRLQETTITEFESQSFTSTFQKHDGRYGSRIAMTVDGDIAVTTQPGGDGFAQISERNSHTWSNLTSVSGTAGESFGYECAISRNDGEIIAICAPTASSSDGKVYLYRTTDNETWPNTTVVSGPSGSVLYFGRSAW